MSDFEKSIQLYEKAYEIAKSIDYMHGISLVVNTLGLAHSQIGNYHKTLDYYKEAFNIDSSSNNEISLANIKSNIALILMYQVKYNETFEQWKEFREQVDDITVIGFKL